MCKAELFAMVTEAELRSRQRLGSSPAPAQQRVTVRQEDGRSRTHGDLLVLQLLRVASVVGFLRQSTPVAVEPSAVLAHPKVLQLLSKPPAHPSAHVVPVDSPLGELLPPQQSMPSKMDRLCLRDESQDRIPFWNPPSRPPPLSCPAVDRCGGAPEAARQEAGGYIKPALEEKRPRIVFE